MPNRDTLRREFINAFLITLGVLSAGMGLHGFLLSSKFIDGGVTGVSMLLEKVTRYPLWFWLPVMNLPFIALGYHQLGRAFAVRSTLAIAGLSLALATVHYPDVTPDLLLTAVFGGLFIGAGIGLAVRGGAVLDGTEIAALLIARRTHLLNVGEAVAAFNAVLFSAAISVLGVEPALYSILTYIAAAKTMNFVIYGLEERTAITIISPHSEAIRAGITRELGHGVTVYRGFGGNTGEEQRILYCVVTRLEIGRVKALVKSVDQTAFVVYHALSSVDGGQVKKGGLEA